MTPKIVPPLPPEDFRGPPYESVEKSLLLAIETAHRTVAFLSRNVVQTKEDIAVIAECARLFIASKDMKMKETLFEKKYKGAKSG